MGRGRGRAGGPLTPTSSPQLMPCCTSPRAGAHRPPQVLQPAVNPACVRPRIYARLVAAAGDSGCARSTQHPQPGLLEAPLLPAARHAPVRRGLPACFYSSIVQLPAHLSLSFPAHLSSLSCLLYIFNSTMAVARWCVGSKSESAITRRMLTQGGRQHHHRHPPRSLPSLPAQQPLL